jgi:hypothetical protein
LYIRADYSDRSKTLTIFASSNAREWVRIPLEASMFVCVYANHPYSDVAHRITKLKNRPRLNKGL